MEDRLQRKGYKRETIEEVISFLKDKDYLNDIRFAKLWSLDRMSTRPRGKRLIRYELKNKGIDETVVDNVLKELETTYDECETARKLAQIRIKQYRELDPLSLKRRLYQYLQRRGFPYEVIHRVIKEILLHLE